MRFNIITILLVTFALIPPPAAPAQDLAQLDEALKAVANYQHGQDGKAIDQMEAAVMAAVKDPQQRAAVEQRLLKALAAATTRDGKYFICKQLRNIATARAVPQLEALLTDAELSHMARYALGRLEDPAAAEALHRALGKTSGKLQAGIIYTLADRNHRAALPDIIKLLGSPDDTVAQAAAKALGHLGGTDAARALQAARAKAAGEQRLQLDGALLSCADRLLQTRQPAEAAPIYEMFYSSNEAPRLRIGGLRGLVAAQPDRAVERLVAAIESDDPELRTSAIGFVREVKQPGVGKTFAALLPALNPEPQELLIRALGDLPDITSTDAIVAATKSEFGSVRIAALEALGSLGAAMQVEVLAQAAATAGGEEQKVARASLLRMRCLNQVDGALVQALGRSDDKVKVEIIRALAGRKAVKALDAIKKASKDSNDDVRREAIRALGVLAGEAELGGLIDLAVSPQDPGDRSTIEGAIASAGRRADDGAKQAGAILAAMKGAPVKAQPTLLRLLARTATPQALETLRASLKDANADVRDAAVRALADWPDATPADDLLAIARTADSEVHKVLALRGYVRMAGQSKKPGAMYLRAMELAQRPDDKKMVLSGLGAADSVEALDLVEGCLDDPQLRTEAALATVQIAGKLRKSNPERARAAAQKVLAVVPKSRAASDAQKLIDTLDKAKANSKPGKAPGRTGKRAKTTRR